MTRITGTLHTFLIISVSVLLGMRNVSYKFSGKIKTHVLCSIMFFFPKIVPFMRKCGISGTQVTDDYIIRRELCIQDNYG